MSIIFADWSGVLAAIILALAIGTAVYLRLVPSREIFGRVGVCRLLAMLFLLVSLSAPQFVHTEKFARGTMLVDISESMDEGTADALLSHAKSFAGGTHAELDIVPFAKESAPIGLASGLAGKFAALRTAWGKLNIGASNLEAALQSTLTSDDQSILLISDGFENQGTVTQILGQLAAHKEKVFPFVPETADISSERFEISQLRAPMIAAAKKSVEIRTSIKNSTREVERGGLQIKHGDKTVLTKDVSVSPGDEVLVVAESDPQVEGIKEITATFIPEKKSFGTSVARIYLSSEEREKVLVLSGSGDDDRVLKQLLKDEAYQVTTAVAGEPEINKLILSDYSVVIFNNISREEVPRKLLETVPEYVKSGGGFLMIGGNKSFGLGGYIDSPIEPVLPVSLIPPQTEKKRLNVAVALVIDKSGSMSENSKINYAKESAMEVIRNLKDDDYITVIGFDDAPFVVIKASLVGEIRSEAEERIGRLYASGRTNLLPAIDEARRNLVRVEAGRKHIIIVTDGKLPDEGPFYLEITKQLRLLGITLSTALIGDETDFAFLKNLADVGGGGFYQTADARNLPRIFLQDVKVSTGERTMKEQSQYEVRTGTGDLSSTKLRSFPPLRGYVETKAKPDSNLELVTLATERAEPLLVSGHYGKGKVAAYTSDANGRWSTAWVEWPKFYEFWSQLIDSVRRTIPSGGDTSPLKFNLKSALDHGSLKVSLEIFGDRDPGEVIASLTTPDGGVKPLVFSRLNKGLYESTTKDPLPGKYEFHGTAGGAKLTSVAFYLSGELFGERKGMGFNRSLLEKIASETGGMVNPDAQQIKNFTQTRTSKFDLSGWAIALAMGFLTLGIVFREVPNLRRKRAAIQN